MIETCSKIKVEIKNHSDQFVAAVHLCNIFHFQFERLALQQKCSTETLNIWYWDISNFKNASKNHNYYYAIVYASETKK